MKDGLAETKEEEVCPICNAKITFKEKDGYVEFWDCPNCGKINLKKEQWKKDILTPSTLPKVHVNCKLCENIYTDNCTDSATPDTCEKYKENMQMSNSDKLLAIIDNKSPLYFKDQYETPYIYIKDSKIKKTYTINTRAFKRYLVKEFYTTLGKTMKSDQLKDAILTLESFTINANSIELKNRVNQLETDNGNEIWVDMCDEFWRSIKITKDGYEIIQVTPPIFRRYSHMEALCNPKNDDNDANDDVLSKLSTPPTSLGNHIIVRGEESVVNTSSIPSYRHLFGIFDFINIPKDDKILMLSAIVSYYFPKKPFVDIAVYGGKGRGKSTALKILKSVIDPSITRILDIPKNRDELLQSLDHHYFCVFDNVSYISNEYSDVFCRVLTGIGTQKRALYTDDEDYTRSIKRPIAFNGINIATTREDLLDRTLLFEVLPISQNRKTEQEIYAEFQEIKPYILHELFTLVSKVLSILPEINPDKLFRMADFTKIGCAVAIALGYEETEFIESYSRKLEDQIKEAVYNDILGNLILDFMEDQEKWIGTPSQYFQLIKEHAKKMGVSTRVKSFPSAPNIMVRDINRLQESLEKIGIKYEHDRTASKRLISFINTNYKKTNTSKITEIFQIQCNDCGKTLQKNEVYTFGYNPYCKECRQKIENQKKGEAQ